MLDKNEERTLEETFSEAERKLESLEQSIAVFEDQPTSKNFQDIARLFEELYFLGICTEKTKDAPELGPYQYTIIGESIHGNDTQNNSSVIYCNYDQKKEVGILNNLGQFYTIVGNLRSDKYEKIEMSTEDVIQHLKELVTKEKNFYKRKKKDSLTIRDKAKQDAKKRREAERDILSNQN